MIKYGSNMLKLQSRRLYHSHMYVVYATLVKRKDLSRHLQGYVMEKGGRMFKERFLKRKLNIYSEILDLRDLTLLDIVVNSVVCMLSGIYYQPH